MKLKTNFSLEKDFYVDAVFRAATLNHAHPLDVVEGDDGLPGAVLDGVRSVSIFTANWALVESKSRAENAPQSVFDGMISVNFLVGTVVLAEDTML